jgi:hypothetical protein
VTRAQQVIKDYNAISGGASPIVIISADQRPYSKEPAQLTAAGRSLTANGLNVLIDASENAMPDVLSGRELILEIREFSDPEMILLPQYKAL